MKKYNSKSLKWLAVFAAFFGVILLTGIIFSVAQFPNVRLSVAFIVLGGLLGILFFACFLAEVSRRFIIDVDSIIFPSGTRINGKIAFHKTVVKTNDIRCVRNSLYKGDGLISKDTYFYTIELKDGRNITVTLYAYGKDAEKEIIEQIQGYIL